MSNRNQQKRQPPPRISLDHVHAVLQLANAGSVVRGTAPAWEHSAFDFELFWDFLRYHRLQNLAWRWMNAPERPESVPADFLAWITAHHESRHPRQQRLWHEMESVASGLREAAIDHAFLKGFPLSWRLYQDLHARHQSDIDILIRLKQLPRVIDYLSSHGFTLKHGRQHISPQKLRTEHAAEFKSEAASIDVHWCLRNAPAYTIDDGAVWDSCQKSSTAGRALTTLSDEYQVMLLLLSMVHDLGRGSLRIKHVIDTYLLATKLDHETDWGSFVDKRRRDNTLLPVANGIAILVHLLKIENPLPRLWNAVEESGVPLSVTTHEQACQLLERPPGAMENRIWFTRVYPGSKLRGALHLVDREFAHAGRIPLIVYRSLRSSYQMTRILCSRQSAG